ncbi:hypothetical protein ACTXT7_002199 [Hymenolepis weldensis]
MIVYFVKDLIWTSLGSKSEFDKVIGSTWKTVADGGYLKYKLENPLSMRSFEAGPMRIFVLVLRSRFNKRREPTALKMIDEPVSANKFNFTKIEPVETLLYLNFREIENCDGNIIANVSPFEFGHSLIVPNCDKLYNQVLRKSPLHMALTTMLLSANDLLAYASVNHLHFHLWYSTHRLYASVCPIRGKEYLPRYMELDFHPVDNFVFEFNSRKDFQPTFDWSDVFFVPMTHNPYPPCLNAPIDFPLSITASFHLKSASALMFSRPYPGDSYKAAFVFCSKDNARMHACHLPAPTLQFIYSLPQHAPLSISHSLQSSLWL